MAEACATDGCRNPSVARSAFCRTCLWRRQHDKPMDGPRRARNTTPRDRLEAAVFDFHEAEDFDSAWDRLRVAMNRFYKAKGWTPPPKSHT